ncbi:hypothetical protein LEH14_27120 [Salmonella enterica]|nr:hypothetical protein [Salmonella enterica]
MGNNSEAEKVTLTVFKGSPHIWAGGLADIDLANWLMSKANAILYLNQYRKEQDEARKRFINYESASQIIAAYTSLGISSDMTDPIHPLSREEIEHAELIASCVAHPEREEGKPVTPVGYSLLPNLTEEQKELQKKKAELLQMVNIQCGKIPGN